MGSSGSVCSLLLLTMAAVSSGRNAAEYFQQAGFQNTPSRPEDALVFFTATAPPLICELEKDGNWIGGDRLNADLILQVLSSSPYYACSFEGNATVHTNLKLVQKSLPNVFISNGVHKIQFSSIRMYCITDSQLPEEYFQLRIQRPGEARPVKCRNSLKGERLYLRFPGYPTIVCKRFERPYHYHLFLLPGIVGDGIACAFQVYVDLQTDDNRTDKSLSESLVRGLPTRADGRISDIICSRHVNLYASAHFQVRLPSGSIYDCNYSDA